MSNRAENLFVPRNNEGRPNLKAFEVADAYHSTLSNADDFPWYMGLSLTGSQIGGYSQAGSDTDLFIFYDTSSVSSSEIEVAAARVKRLLENSKLFTRTEPVLIDITIPESLTPEWIQNEIKNASFVQMLQALSFPLKGDRVMLQRSRIANLIHELEPAAKESVLFQVAEQWMEVEGWRASERTARGLTEDDAQARRKLIEKRLRVIYDRKYDTANSTV